SSFYLKCPRAQRVVRRFVTPAKAGIQPLPDCAPRKPAPRRVFLYPEAELLPQRLDHRPLQRAARIIAQAIQFGPAPASTQATFDKQNDARRMSFCDVERMGREQYAGARVNPFFEMAFQREGAARIEA